MTSLFRTSPAFSSFSPTLSPHPLLPLSPHHLSPHHLPLSLTLPPPPPLHRPAAAAASAAAAEKAAAALRLQCSERQAQRERNLRALGSPGAPHSELRSLDSSVKKNTAFVKKLRSAVTEAQGETLLADAARLNLSKYLSEVAASLAQAGGVVRRPSADVAAELAQQLTLRYGEAFAEALREAVQAQLAAEAVPHSAEDAAAAAAYRYTFRFYAELVLRGLLPESEGRALCKRLAGLMAKDKDALQLLPMIIALLRPLLGELAALPPRASRLLSEAHNVDLTPTPVFPELAEQVRGGGGGRGGRVAAHHACAAALRPACRTLTEHGSRFSRSASCSKCTGHRPQITSSRRKRT